MLGSSYYAFVIPVQTGIQENEQASATTHKPFPQPLSRTFKRYFHSREMIHDGRNPVLFAHALVKEKQSYAVNRSLQRVGTVFRLFRSGGRSSSPLTAHSNHIVDLANGIPHPIQMLQAFHIQR